MRNLLRIALALLAIGLLRYLISAVMSAIRKASAGRPASPMPQAPPVATTGQLKRDPVCGTYVAAGSAVTAQVSGQTVHYCSAACRDKHLEQRRA